MSTNSVQPKSIDPVSPQELRIEWADGAASFYRARQLRLACPCAQCVEEGSGKKVLKDQQVPQDIILRNTDLVGRYALSFIWSDGHKTGIFSFDYLRQLAGLDQKGPAAPAP